MDMRPETYYFKDNGVFPNSRYPVLLYRNYFQKLPFFFAGRHITTYFRKNNWGNSWNGGIFTNHHYHSTTHEAMGVCRGKSEILLGGDNGTVVKLKKGDVLVIPAGVAHKNLGKMNQIKVSVAYPSSMNYDILYGKPFERPYADNNIRKVPIPVTDPVEGLQGYLVKLWKNNTFSATPS